MDGREIARRRLRIYLYNGLFLHAAARLYMALGQGGFFLCWALATGLLTGTSVTVMMAAAGLLEHAASAMGAGRFALLLFTLFPLFGMAVSSLVKSCLSRSDSSVDMTLLIQAIRERDPKLIKLETLSHIIAGGFTIGCGASAGFATPGVLTGASIGSAISSALKITPDKAIRLMTCGVAGGIAAVFGAPIAGVLFAIEALLPKMSIGSLAPVLLSAVAASTVVRSALGGPILSGIQTGGWTVGGLPFYAAAGVVSALAGVYMIKADGFAARLVRAGFKSRPARLIFCGLLVCAAVWLLPELRGDGLKAAEILTESGSLFAGAGEAVRGLDAKAVLPAVLFACLLALSKPVVTSLTLEGGGSGGYFAPSLFTGAFTGFAFGKILNLCGFADAGGINFALLGMCGTFTAAFHAPLSGIFLVAEMTGGESILIPLTAVGAAAYFTAAMIEEKTTIYTVDADAYLEHEISYSAPDDPPTLLPMMVSGVKVVRSLSEIENMETHGLPIPLVDSNGALAGLVRFDALTGGKALSMPDGIVRTDDPPALARAAMRIFSASTLPVLDSRGKFLGYVTRDSLGMTDPGSARESGQDALQGGTCKSHPETGAKSVSDPGRK